jgi:tetratricopeptide (TPR) repeat protein
MAERAGHLHGWKAIGVFVGHDERTAKRWEAHRAMPVHRLPGGGKATVWADEAELTSWMKGAARSGNGPGGPDAADRKPLPLPASRLRAWLGAAALAGLFLLSASAALAGWEYHSRAAPAVAAADTPYDDDAKARALYLNAHFGVYTRSPDGLRDAIGDYRRLTLLYPDRAAAFAGLSEAYLLVREFGTTPEAKAYPAAEAAARRALALDPHLASAWRDEAFVQFWWRHQVVTGFASFETALRLDPQSAQTMHWYANALAVRGRTSQALRLFARARGLDPTSPALVADEALAEIGAGRPQAALVALERLVRSEPQFLSGHRYLAAAYFLLGRDSDYLREAQIAAHMRNEAAQEATLGAARADLAQGGRRAMLSSLASAARSAAGAGTGSALSAAEFSAWLGRRDAMIQWLDRSVARNEADLLGLPADPAFLSYRGDPRFRAILARVVSGGLPRPLLS